MVGNDMLRAELSKRRKYGALLLFAPLLVASATQADRGQRIAPGDVAAFRTLRAEAVSAANSGDLESARSKLVSADALVPNHAGIVLLLAKVALESNDLKEALKQASRLARMGVASDILLDERIQPIKDEPEFTRAAALFRQNSDAKGALKRVASLPGDNIVDGMVWDPGGRRFLLSGVRSKTIVALSPNGEARAYLTSSAPVGAIMGLAIDAKRDRLWAASSGSMAVPELSEELRGTSELLEIRLGTGEILRRYKAQGDAKRAFGDLAVAKDGAIIVSDTETGEILQLRPGAEALAILVPRGFFGSPQGIVLTSKGDDLIVADYSSGLYRVSASTGHVVRLKQPVDTTLLGIDGLSRDGRCIIAVQNGTAPERVLRLWMNPGLERIERVDVLAVNADGLDEPTSGVLHSGTFTFVSRSQFGSFAENGTARKAVVEPALIASLDLGDMRKNCA